MNAVVVTASRREAPLRDAPVLVTRIDPVELEHSAEETVDEFLRNIPEITTMRTFVGECGPGRELTLRGMPSQKRTLVLVNGIPMNDPFSGAVNWSIIPKQAVASIEIVNGPMSALYGSGAMGGVINIITKRPSETVGTLAEASYGSYNTASLFLQGSGTSGAHGFYAAGRMYRTDGYMKVIHPESYHEDNERTDWNLITEYTYEPNERSRITVGAHAVEEEYSRGRIFTDQTNRQTGAHITYATDLSELGSLSASLYGNSSYRYVEVSGPAPAYNALEHTEEDDMSRLGQLFAATIELADGNLLSAGIDSSYNWFDKYNEYKTSDRRAEAEGKQLLASIFVQDEMTWERGDSKIITTVGIRGDYSKNYDGRMFDPGINVDNDYGSKSWNSVTPKLGFVWQQGDSTTFRAAVGTSFAAPTLSEMYTVFRRGPTTVNGNPDLEPESSLSFNAGFDQQITERASLRVDGYYTKGEDFISTRLQAPPFTYVYDNISEIEVVGIGTEIRYTMTGQLSCYAGYVYNESTVLEDPVKPTNEGNFIAFQPKHKGRIGARWHQDGWAVDISANYFGERYTAVENTEASLLDDYISLDLFISKRFNDNLKVSLGFENLLDERYELYSLPLDESFAPGLLITAAVEVRL